MSARHTMIEATDGRDSERPSGQANASHCQRLRIRERDANRIIQADRFPSWYSAVLDVTGRPKPWSWSFEETGVMVKRYRAILTQAVGGDSVAARHLL